MHAPKDNEPTKLQLLMLLLKSPDSPQADHDGVTISVSLPAALFTRIDALSQHSGQRRSKVISELIEVALGDVERELNELDRVAIASLQRDIAQSMSLHQAPL